MMDFRKVRLVQNEFIKKNNHSYKRYFFNKIDFNSNLMGIIGAKGVGKTTFLIQCLLEAPFKLNIKTLLEKLDMKNDYNRLYRYLYYLKKLKIFNILIQKQEEIIYFLNLRNSIYQIQICIMNIVKWLKLERLKRCFL